MLAASASWADVTARADVGVAQPVSSPTRDYFGTGFDVAAALSVDVASFLELGARLSYVFVSQAPGSPFSGPASLIEVGPALRVHRPREGVRWAWWGELGVAYVRTGSLDRLGVSLGGGVQFALTDRFWLGPWVGVHQVFRIADTEEYPTRDATLFCAGIAIELALYAPRRAPPKEEVKVPVDPDPDRDGVLAPDDRCPNTKEDKDGYEDDDGCPDVDDDSDGVLDADDACPRASGPASTHGCPDRDLDGIADADDRCPDVRGVVAESGCPSYRELKIGTTRIELSRLVAFPRGGSTIPSGAVPMLDELALALGDRATLCVRIGAHADGPANQALAKARADAVRLHLMTKGVAPSRLSANAEGGPGDVELTLVPCEVKTP